MGFRAPVFKELLLIFENPSRGYIVEGNPDLVPERSQSVNLGTEFKPTKAALLSINAFHNDIDDLIFIEAVGEPVVGQTQKYIYTNIASAFTRGIETQAQYSYKSILTLKAGYVFTDSRDNKRKRKLEGRALHRGTFDLRFHQQTFGIETTFRASIVGQRPFYTDSAEDESYETEFSDSYTTADFRLAKQIGQTLKVFAGIENILNTGESEYLPIQPRTFYGGISGQI
jgi:outer membrane receptor for ferrienterochelin and colicins